MNPTQKHFTSSDRLFHLGLMITFLTQAVTGLGELTMRTPWCTAWVATKMVSIHYIVGIMMTFLFLIHGGNTLLRMGRSGWFGTAPLLFSWRDLRHIGTNVKWILGMGPPARLGRWSYWEKFDYWALFWGMPILAITGLMLLHRAEALLALLHIFGIHFFMGHMGVS